MKFSLLKVLFFVALFSFFFPFFASATFDFIIPNDYIDIGIPYGIALDSEENRYVVDTMNRKILVFDSNGDFIRSIGKSGSGDSDFIDNIYSIDIDNNDYFYVGGECYVYKFSPNGAFISRWGGCGDNEGQLGSVKGIHYDASQNRIILSDTSKNRVQVFTKSGVVIDSFGSSGAGNGQFNEPYGLATDSLGNIFVVDTSNHRVQKFDKDFNYVAKFGTEGDDAGEFRSPKDIKIASNGNLIITSQNSYDIVIYSSSLNFVSEFGEEGGDAGEFHAPCYIDLDEDNNIFVTDWQNVTIQKFSSAGVFDSIIGNAAKSNGKFYIPTAAVYDSSGNMYVLDDGAVIPRVQKFNSSGVYQSTIISEGLYLSSYYMTIDESNNLYISGERGVRVYDTTGTFVRAIGEFGTGEGQFRQARGMDFDSDGNIYIADFYNSVVHVYDDEGVFVRSIGTQGDDDGEFISPRAVLVDDSGSGYVYVSDSNSYDVYPSELEIARVQKFDLTGTYISTIVTAGEGFSDYSIINDLQMDALGNIYVVDSDKNRIQYIDDEGTLWDTIGMYGSGLGQLYGPTGVFLNSSTELISIVDSLNHRVFTKPNGTRISNLSSEIDVIRTDTDDSVVYDYVDNEDPSIGALDAMLYSSDVPVAGFILDLANDRDWSDVTIASLPEKAKVFVNNLDGDGAPGISATKDIFVPKYEGQEKLLVCPDVLTLVDIELGCTDGYILTTESENVAIEELDGQNYWVVTDSDANGFMSYSTTRLDIVAEDNTVYVNEALNVTITPIAEGDALDTNYIGDVEVVSTPYVTVSHSVVAFNKPVQPVTKQITFTEEGVYSIIVEDVDDPALTDTVADITVLGIQDEVEEEEEEEEEEENGDNNYIYATRELTCVEDPTQDKCEVLAYIDGIVFTKLSDSSAKICWNQSIEGESYLQLTENGQPIGERIIAETTDGLLYCATVLGLTDSGNYEFLITISEVKDDENISGSYEGTFSMKDETITENVDDIGKDLEEDKSGNNLLKKILIFSGIGLVAFIILFIIIKRRKEEESN
jgi:sugar lactone lactonase YvrE